MSDTNQIRRILMDTRVIAMVGLSAKWHRPSYFAAKYLIDHGYRVIPVNPNYDEILGEKCYPDLKSIPNPVDVVDLFQRVELCPGYAREGVEIGAKIIWLQLGLCSDEARQITEDGGLEYVENRCMKIEHGRIFGGLNFMGVDTKIISSTRLKSIAN